MNAGCAAANLNRNIKKKLPEPFVEKKCSVLQIVCVDLSSVKASYSNNVFHKPSDLSSF